MGCSNDSNIKTNENQIRISKKFKKKENSDLNNVIPDETCGPTVILKDIKKNENGNNNNNINKNNNKTSNEEERNDDFEIFNKIKTLKKGKNVEHSFLVKSIKTCCEYAYKKVDIQDPNDEMTKRILKEVEILKKINHPNIIKLYEAILSDDKKYMEILTEYADGGDLQMQLNEHKKINKPFEENQLLIWLVQVCLALKDLHNNYNILHRNIKPSNIFLMDPGFAKLGDFGMAKILTSKEPFKRAKTIFKDLEYSAPEILEKRGYTKKTDIWYLGVTFFELMTFCFPFMGETEEEISENILKENKNKFNQSYNKKFNELIDRMISKDEGNRPSSEEILEMPFMKTRMECYLQENDLNYLKVQKTMKDYEDDMPEDEFINHKIKVVENDKKVKFNEEKNKEFEGKKVRKSALDLYRQFTNIKELIKPAKTIKH